MKTYLCLIVIAGATFAGLVSCNSNSNNKGNTGSEKSNADQKEASSAPATGQNGILADGERLFNSNCASCHALTEKMIGPPLKDISKKYDQKWLIDFIRDSKGMIEAGDPQAVQIYEEYNRQPMTSFSNLSDDDIKAILQYIENSEVMVKAD